MKTDQRQERELNDLSEVLEEGSHLIGPYAKVLLGVALLAGAIGLGIGYVTSKRTESEQAAWTAYYDAVDTGDMAKLADVMTNHPSSVAAKWAALSSGDVRLGTGLRELFNDRDKAKTELTAAREAYDSTLKIAAGDAMLDPRARFGLAQSLEALGELDQAKETYNQIVSRWGDTSIANLAKNRLDQLARPQTQQWYTWFAEQKPVKRPLDDPSLFQDLPNLPEKPDLNVPQPGQLLPGDGDAPATQDSSDLPTVTDPATEAPASETPAVEAPAAETPAAEAPAAEVPATEAPAAEAPAAEAPSTEPPASESTETPANP